MGYTQTQLSRNWEYCVYVFCRKKYKLSTLIFVIEKLKPEQMICPKSIYIWRPLNCNWQPKELHFTLPNKNVPNKFFPKFFSTCRQRLFLRKAVNRCFLMLHLKQFLTFCSVWHISSLFVCKGYFNVKNTDQKNSEHEHFSCSLCEFLSYTIMPFIIVITLS